MKQGKPSIFVTGASGFIGGAICKHLVKQGYSIKAMARSKKSIDKVTALGALASHCDLQSISEKDLTDCSIIIYSAAHVAPWGTLSQYWKTNVEGTQHLLTIAKKAGVKRFIHISSEATVFHAKPMKNIDENESYALNSRFPYCRTKALSEKAVLEASDPKNNFTTIALRPRLVWGPGDQNIVPTIVNSINRGLFFWVDRGEHTTTTTHIDNLVHAVDCALTKGNTGQAYFVTDDNQVTFKEFITTQLLQQKITAPNKSLPSWLLRPLSSFTNWLWNFFHLKSTPPLPHFGVYILSYDCKINIQNARKELGYEPEDMFRMNA